MTGQGIAIAALSLAVVILAALLAGELRKTTARRIEELEELRKAG